MSRINVEDSLFSDPRFIALSKSIGSDAALGKLVMAWKVAQGYWVKDELVPIRFWELLKLEILTEFDFSVITENGVYVRGTEENFAWLKQKQEAGRKGGLAKASKKLAKPSTATLSLEQNTSESYPPTPTPSPTPTLNTNTSLVVSDKEDVASGVFDDIAALWNEMALLNALPKVKTPLSKDRRKKVKLALEEFKDYSDWVRIINGVVDNDFNLGVNDRKWKANFDWLFHTTRFNYRKLWEAGSEENN